MISEQEALDRLHAGEIQLPPLMIEAQQTEAYLGRGERSDAIVRVRWRDRTYDFDVEYKPYATPKMLQQAIDQVRERARARGRYPMLLTPFFSEEKLRVLEARQVSGLDLSGNGVVVVPGELLVLRTGAPNRFPSSTPIKNIYRGASSLVARVFLLSPRYRKVTEIQEEIQRRGGRLALATVSKALKALEEDLIVGRASGEIWLLQPAKLLDRLVENFRPPQVRQQFRGKLPGNRDAVMSTLSERAKREALQIAVTGAGSANHYGVVARGEMVTLYCRRLLWLLDFLPLEQTNRFPNLEVFETEDETAYFDLRRQGDCPWASPIQTYLELMQGDKRDQETATQLRQSILRLSGKDR